MDPSSGQSQQMSSQSSLENMLVCSTQQEKKPKPQPEQAQKCPRCDSTNTKFCYYNNYSLSQPRYFCKSCRRYWTKGGTLRNVPVGGGCRKNKRSSSSSSKRIQDQSFSPNLINPFNSLSYDHPSDLTLALARLQKQTCGVGQLMGYDNSGHHDFSILGNNPTNSFGDILGNSISNMNFLGSGTTTTQYNNSNDNVVQNMYGTVYNGNGDTCGEVNSSCGVQMMFPYEQEMNNAVTNNNSVSESKVLGGFPWQQLNGGANMGEVDSGRANWNGFTTSSWHGLLNSPLI